MVIISHVLKRAGWGLPLTAKESYKSNAHIGAPLIPGLCTYFLKKPKIELVICDRWREGWSNGGKEIVNEYTNAFLSSSTLLSFQKCNSSPFFNISLLRGALSSLSFFHPSLCPLPHSSGGVMFSHLPTQVGVSAHRGSHPHVHRPPSSCLGRLIRLPAFI